MSMSCGDLKLGICLLTSAIFNNGMQFTHYFGPHADLQNTVKF